MEGVFAVGQRSEVFPLPGGRGGGQHRFFDIHPDGDRFLMPTGGGIVSGDQVGTVYVVANWFEELRQRMGN